MTVDDKIYNLSYLYSDPYSLDDLTWEYLHSFPFGNVDDFKAHYRLNLDYFNIHSLGFVTD